MVSKLSALFATGLLVFAVGFSAACGDDNSDDDATVTPGQTSEPTTGPTQASFPGEVQLTDVDDGSTAQLANGGTLIIALPSNPTAGYSWSVSDASDPQLELQGEPAFVPAGSTSPVGGTGGTEVFTFEAVESGSASLVLEYRLESQPEGPPEESFQVTVEIR